MNQPPSSPDRDDRTEACSPASDASGTVIAGRYRLLQQIGEGGFGVVYQAEQREPVQRTVALKIIKPGMDSAQIIARFEQERQALALMDHPNIAKVLDGGTTEQGRPYFVMELVKGIPVTKFCDEQKLTPRQRLELFLPICHAIQHAHHKGIIHRDLKPSNVLVTLLDRKPVPKVIDFGVAKAVHQRLTERTMFTEIGALVGTPEYMSPEQAGVNQLDVDTRSDVYSLGVLLYELLTGVTPLDRKRFRQAAVDEVMRLIREEEPSKPSTRITTIEQLPSVAALRQLEPKKLQQVLRGELDWVVMKALEKDRDRRYETVNSLAQDIERYLSDEPVLASPPSTLYRVQKFIRRNRGPVLAASLIVLALVGGVVGMTAGFVRAQHERDEKEKARAAAEESALQARRAVDEYFTTISESKLLNVSGLQPLRKELLESARKYYEQFTQARADDPAAQADLGKAYYYLGRITDDFGSKAQAVAAFEKARGIQERLVKASPSGAEPREDLARTCWYLGQVQSWTGQWDKAFASHEQARTLREGLVSEFPDDPQHRNNLASSYGNIAVLLTRTGKYAEALQRAQQACDFGRQLLREHPAVSDFRVELARNCSRLGDCLESLERYEDGLQANEEGRDHRLALIATTPGHLELLHELCRSYNDVGFNLLSLKRNDDALKAFREGLEKIDKLVAENPSVVEFRNTQSIAVSQLGRAQRAAGDVAAARQSFEKAAAISELVARDSPTVIVYEENLAMRHWQLAYFLHATGESDASLPYYRKAHAAFARLAKDYPQMPGHPRSLARVAGEMGNLMWDRGQIDEARRLLAQYGQELARFAATPTATASEQNALAWFLVACPATELRDAKAALVAAKKAVELAPASGSYWNTLGTAHYRNEDWKACIAALEKSNSLRSGGDAYDFYFIALSHWQLGDKDQARQWHEKARKSMEGKAAPDTDLVRIRAEAESILATSP